MTDKVKEKVLDCIKKGEVKQKSHWYFVLRGLLFAAGFVLFFLLALFLSSFLFFLQALPGLILLAVVVIVVVLELLSRHYEFVYKRPLVYSALALVLLLVVGGSLIAKTRMHEKAGERAFDKRLPVAGPMYRKYMMKEEMKERMRHLPPELRQKIRKEIGERKLRHTP